MALVANVSRGDWSHIKVCLLIAQAPFHLCVGKKKKKKRSENLKRMEPQDGRSWVLEWSHGAKPLPQTTSHPAFPTELCFRSSCHCFQLWCRVNSPEDVGRKPFWASVIKHWEKVAITTAPRLPQLCCRIALQSRTFTRSSEACSLSRWLSW